MLGHQSGLTLLVIGTHFLGITAFGFTAFALIGFHHHKCAAKAFDLLGSGAAHIGCRHNRAQTLGGCNGLQTRNACAHNENARGRDRARRRHHHRQRPAIFSRGVKHRLIT